MHDTRELTGDKIVEVAFRSERELADEGEPGQQPGRELLGEDRPDELLLAAPTPLLACRIGQANSLRGVGHGSAAVVDSALCAVLPERVQAFGKVRSCDRNEEEREDREKFGSARSDHVLDIGGGGVRRREEGDLRPQWTLFVGWRCIR